jgi:hypothetical protein
MWLLYVLHVSGIIHYLSFCNWLIYLADCPQGSSMWHFPPKPLMTSLQCPLCSSLLNIDLFGVCPRVSSVSIVPSPWVAFTCMALVMVYTLMGSDTHLQPRLLPMLQAVQLSMTLFLRYFVSMSSVDFLVNLALAKLFILSLSPLWEMDTINYSWPKIVFLTYSFSSSFIESKTDYHVSSLKYSFLTGSSDSILMPPLNILWKQSFSSVNLILTTLFYWKHLVASNRLWNNVQTS